MKLYQSIRDAVRAYPFRERMPLALMIGAILTWHIHRHWPLKLSVVPGYCALFILLLLDRRGRAFWCLWGVVIGITLAEVIPIVQLLMASWQVSHP